PSQSRVLFSRRKRADQNNCRTAEVRKVIWSEPRRRGPATLDPSDLEEVTGQQDGMRPHRLGVFGFSPRWEREEPWRQPAQAAHYLADRGCGGVVCQQMADVVLRFPDPLTGFDITCAPSSDGPRLTRPGGNRRRSRFAS